MKIEDAIQSTFMNDTQKAKINILFTASWLNQSHLTVFKPFKLTTTQYNVLRILKGQYPNPTTVADIINRMIDKSSNASRIIDRLEKKKWVTRNTCKKDKRQVDVVITPSGLDLINQIDPSLTTLEQNLTGLNPEELIQLNDLLNKFRNQ